jgi:histidine kinase
VRQEKKEVWVKVTDTGIGIPAHELENIFREFYQVEDHLRRRMGGMGVGLSIARGLLKLHHGRIWAESPGEGKGSTFTVVLPVQ